MILIIVNFYFLIKSILIKREMIKSAVNIIDANIAEGDAVHSR